MKTGQILLFIVIAIVTSIASALAVLILLPLPTIDIPVPVSAPSRRPPPRRSPEFRKPPYRQYKPKSFQIVGILSNGTETLPLYGRVTLSRRDSWNYYSVTPGQQLYPLAVTHNGKDCTDQTVGCNELLGGETVSVATKSGTYTVDMYDVRQIPYNPNI